MAHDEERRAFVIQTVGKKAGMPKRAHFCAPKFGTTDWPTHGHTDTQKKGSAGQNLSGRARAIFTRAVNLRGFPPGVPTGVGKNICALTTRGLGAPLATSRWREERSENVSREDARRDWIMLMSS